MDFNNIYSIVDLEDAKTIHTAAIFYFSGQDCNVCKVLKPKLKFMLEESFPEFRLFYIDVEKSPLIAGQMRIFSIPTILIYFEGKEFYRVSRNISPDELGKTIKRPYEMLFNPVW